ncbi:MAG: LytTR family transcriptional regulator [Ruminococcus sp.]|nr:LytTR family transcriptional regulator [Ruminococcus sp.]
MAENAVWHGPAIGQYIAGLEHIREAWSKEENPLTFTLGNLKAEYLRTSPSSCEVMMMFVVTTHYPNGEDISLFQRIHFSWADTVYTDENKLRKRVPKIFMTHISNPVEQHSADFIYPLHYNEVYGKAKDAVRETRISFRGTNNAFYAVAVSSVIRIETTADQCCLIYTRDKALKTRTAMKELEKQTEGFLVRIHSGYIVNPLDVVSVCRFKVTMSDGAVLPIPEKNYTAVKKILLGEKQAQDH